MKNRHVHTFFQLQANIQVWVGPNVIWDLKLTSYFFSYICIQLITESLKAKTHTLLGLKIVQAYDDVDLLYLIDFSCRQTF